MPSLTFPNWPRFSGWRHSEAAPGKTPIAGRGICRAVVHQDHLEWGVGLPQDRVQRLAQVRLAVEDGNDDRNTGPPRERSRYHRGGCECGLVDQRHRLALRHLAHEPIIRLLHERARPGEQTDRSSGDALGLHDLRSIDEADTSGAIHRPMPPRVAGFVLLCLASLLAGCSNDGAAPSTPPASTQQAVATRTAEKAGQGTNEAEAPAPARTETELGPESLYALQPTLRCLERRPGLATSSAATTVGCRRCETWLNGRPSSRNSRARASESPWSRAVRTRVSSQSSCAPRKTLIASSDGGTPCCSSSRERGTCSTSWWVVYAGRLSQGVAHDQLRLGKAVLERRRLQIVVSRGCSRITARPLIRIRNRRRPAHDPDDAVNVTPSRAGRRLARLRWRRR